MDLRTIKFNISNKCKVTAVHLVSGFYKFKPIVEDMFYVDGLPAEVRTATPFIVVSSYTPRSCERLAVIRAAEGEHSKGCGFTVEGGELLACLELADQRLPWRQLRAELRQLGVCGAKCSDYMAMKIYYIATRVRPEIRPLLEDSLDVAEARAMLIIDQILELAKMLDSKALDAVIVALKQIRSSRQKQAASEDRSLLARL